TLNPYYTTNNAAASRAIEIRADIMLKTTKVERVFTTDPVKDPNANLYRSLSYMDVLQKELKVMDATAVSLGMDNGLPLVVFDLTARGNILRVVRGENVGTLVGCVPTVTV